MRYALYIESPFDWLGKHRDFKTLAEARSEFDRIKAEGWPCHIELQDYESQNKNIAGYEVIAAEAQP